MNDPAYSFTELSLIAKIRYWQLSLNEMLLEKKFNIPIHLAFGHESLSVAISRSLHANDCICLTHRNVSYNLCYCDDLNDVLDYYKLLDSKRQYCQMGSMNLAISKSPVIYTSSILGNNLSVAAGISLNRHLSKRDGVVFALTGDGAIEEGSFWETLLFARSHRLKLVVVVENNNYSLGSTIPQRRSQINLQEICQGLDVKYFSCDGANYLSTKDTLSMAREYANSKTPVCVESNISTLCRHAGSTPGWATDPMKISICNGLIIEHSNRDPLYQLQQLCDPDQFQSLTDSFF